MPFWNRRLPWIPQPRSRDGAPAWPQLLAFLLSLLTLAATASDPPHPPIPTPLPSPVLHNLHRIATNLLSGGSPESEAAFAELKALGVTTILSVDGAKPDVATAQRHGLRYIHLPIGYDGIPALRQAQLIQAARQSTGAIYVHCHHGRHRGPAALAIIAEGLCFWSDTEATNWLHQAGTSPEYAGLYRSVAEFRAPDDATLAALAVPPETAPTPPVVDAMVAIDSHFESLKASQANSWTAPPAPPDRPPAHEATLLREQLRELARHPDTSQRPDHYRTLLAESAQAAERLAHVLRATPPNLSDADAALHSLGQSCSTCHRRYRN